MKRFSFPVIFSILIVPVYCAGMSQEGDVTHLMMMFAFQIAVIIFFAKTAGALFKKAKLPSVLGELSVGILISPFLLGSISLPFFPGGLFPLHTGSMPVSMELYGLATIASILLLFLAGLETDIEMFLTYSVAGVIVGIGGAIVSFCLGSATGMYFLDLPFLSPAVLFMGLVSTATSVGITARILSERKKIDSPEGITILGGAVVGDIVGIVLLAVTLSIAGTHVSGKTGVDWNTIGLIVFKALGVLVIFLVSGLVFAHKISALLKKTGDRYSITILSLGLALMVSGFFEKAGLAMIIGAYITGLSLSKTDISYIVQETLHPLQTFLVPVFFVIMGMLVNVNVFMDKRTLVFGGIFTAGAIFAKFLGCGLSSLFLGFNKIGALRIGVGTIQRGEVALIMAGVGFSSGILDTETFGVVVKMALITTLIAPPLLNISLKSNLKGTRKEPVAKKAVSTKFRFESEVITDGLVNHIREYLSSEGFYIYMIKAEHKIYQIRKDKLFIKMLHYPEKIIFLTSEEDSGFVKALVYEAFVDLYQDVQRINCNEMPADLIRNIGAEHICNGGVDLSHMIITDCVKMDIKSSDKEGVVRELVTLFYKKGYINDTEKVVKEVLERESIVSTGFENGFACPHARVDSTDHIHLAVGIKREGVNFESYDGKPTKLIVLLLSSIKNPEKHVQTLASLASIFMKKKNMNRILRAETPKEIVSLFSKLSSRKYG